MLGHDTSDPSKRVSRKENFTFVKQVLVSRFEFVIGSMNNLKKARRKIVNQSENGYG